VPGTSGSGGIIYALSERQIATREARRCLIHIGAFTHTG